MAWVLGDPAGIGPELVAKSLANPDMGKVSHPVVVGPIWLLERGMQVAKIETLEQNPVGQHLYPRLGFQEVARQIHYAMRLPEVIPGEGAVR